LQKHKHAYRDKVNNEGYNEVGK